MKLTSPIIDREGRIPSRYTCDGENVSPPLHWDGVPATAEALALIVDDPDAPAKVWTHWVLYDIPTDTTDLPEGVAPGAIATPGRNDFDNTGYGGPCPPRGTHRYRFTLYALDAKLNLPEGATKGDVLRAMERHILEQDQLVGTYARA